MGKAKWIALLFVAVIAFGFSSLAAADSSSVNTALLQAASNGDTNEVRVLISQGADVNTRDAHGMTPLMWAATYGHTDTVKLLIQDGADVSAVNNVGWSVLRMAAGHQDIIDILRDAGARDLFKNSRVKD